MSDGQTLCEVSVSQVRKTYQIFTDYSKHFFGFSTHDGSKQAQQDVGGTAVSALYGECKAIFNAVMHCPHTDCHLRVYSDSQDAISELSLIFNNFWGAARGWGSEMRADEKR